MSNNIDNKTYQDDAIMHTKYSKRYLLKLVDMPARRTPKVEALVVNAIRRLQDVQGSTSREISNYISQEYNVPSEETRRQVQFALRRGLSYGILKRSRRYELSNSSNFIFRIFSRRVRLQRILHFVNIRVNNNNGKIFIRTEVILEVKSYVLIREL